MNANPDKKVAIVILTRNNLEYSKNCLDSIRKHTKKDSYELIVVDNNSTDGTREWLGAQPDLKLKLNDSNVGFPKGCNMGIALAGEDSDILLLNNDTVVTANWLENLKRCLYSDEKIGAAGAVSNHNENLQGVDFQYDDLDQMQILAEKNNISDSSKWEQKIFLIGFCILIKREVIRKIGNLDEDYTPGYVEDNDFSLRIVSAGYRLVLCHDCFIHHYLGTGFRKDLKSFYPVLFKNREIFKKKWGFETYLFDELDYASLRIFKEPDRQRKLRVLELGCGIGVTLLKIKYECPNAELYGIEPDKSAAAAAGGIARTAANPLDSPLDFPENFFDYIFTGDTVERVESPERYLTELKRILKPGGFLIGRFQNAMHYSAIRSILKGSWYFSQDTLKKTRRSFFTLDDISMIFARCGYREPYIFHWFSAPNETEKRFIEDICGLAENKNSYLYNTYLFSVRFRK